MEILVLVLKWSLLFSIVEGAQHKWDPMNFGTKEKWKVRLVRLEQKENPHQIPIATFLEGMPC